MKAGLVMMRSRALAAARAARVRSLINSRSF